MRPRTTTNFAARLHRAVSAVLISVAVVSAAVAGSAAAAGAAAPASKAHHHKIHRVRCTRRTFNVYYTYGKHRRHETCFAGTGTLSVNYLWYLRRITTGDTRGSMQLVYHGSFAGLPVHFKPHRTVRWKHPWADEAQLVVLTIR